MAEGGGIRGFFRLVRAVVQAMLRHLPSGTLLIVIFGSAALVGAAALLLPGVIGSTPIDVPPGDTPIESPLNSLFMAVSAVCVTGLTVFDIGTVYTPFGQLIILLLIQFGGIGIITVGRLVMLRHQERLDPGTRELVAETFGILPRVRPIAVLHQAVIYTGICELLGFLLLAPPFIARFGWSEGLWAAVFHSISAFCNAGFGLWRDSLSEFSGHLYVNVVVMSLIVAGGLGFLVIADALRWLRERAARLPSRITLHSKVVLITTGCLLLIGGLVIWLLAHFNEGMAGEAGFMQCLFLSTTARTAGFNTLDTALWSNPTLLVVILLMIVGGSPGSTAGGVKTTTLASLVAVVTSRSRNRPGVELFKRQLSNETVAKALVTLAGMLGAIVVGVILLEVTEVGMRPHGGPRPFGFLDHLFEVVSALCTVGLSTGVTTELSAGGRVVIIFCMFLGRLGPLLVASSLIGHRKRVALSFANEDIMVG